MARGNETTTKFKVDISELKKGIQDANRQIKLANAEFKAASASMENWGKSTDGLTAKINQTEKVLKAQKTILNDYKRQLALIVAEYGENSKEADEMRIKIENQRATVINTQRALGDYQSKLSDLEAEQKKAAEAVEKEARAYDKLKGRISEQEKQLKDLKSEYASVVLEQGKNSDAAQELAGKIDSLSGELKDNKKALSDAEEAAGELDNSLDDTGEGAKEVSDGFSVFKGVLADLVATGIKAAISGLKDLASTAKESFKEFDEGRDAVIKATGATGEAAKDLQKSYAEVARSVVGDMGDIGSALGEVNTRFGYTGNELEDATTKFMKFADITGTDAVSAVQLVSRAMGDAGIDSSEYVSVLDDLAVAAQASGISVDKLTELLTKYGAPMRALGFETKDAIAIFSQWEKAGVNTEIAFSGMKTAISKWSADGKDARIEFRKTLDEIAAAPDIASATTKAIEVFGKKAGPDLADAIQGGRFEYSQFLDLIEGSDGAVENTFAQTQDASDKVKLAFQGMKVSIGETVSEIVDKYGPDIEKAISAITPVIQNVIRWIGEKIPPAIETVKSVFDTIAPVVQSVFGWILDNKDAIIAAIVGIGAAIVAWNIATVVANIMKMVTAIKAMGAAAAFTAAKQWLLNTALFANPIGLVIAAIAGLVTAFIVLWKRSEKFRNFWLDLWEKVKTVAGSAWEAIKGFFSGAVETIQSAWSGVTEFFSGIWESIKSIFSTIADWIAENVFKPIIDYFAPVITFYTEAWNIIKELAAGCWEAIKAIWGVVSEWFNMNVIQPVATFFSDLWNGIKTAASTTWEGIKAVWNAVSGWFKSTIITPVSKWFSDMWDGLKKKASDAWDGIKSVFTPVVDWFKDKFSKAWKAVKDVFSTGGQVFEGIKDGIVSAFKTVVNAIIRGINRVIAIPFNAINGILDRIQGVSIAGIQPFDFLNTRLTVPQIPQLEKGGILKKGQVGFLEGKGAEAVVPLENNKKWIAATAADLKKALIAEGIISKKNIQKQEVVNNYNFTQNNTSPKALSRLEIYRQSKRLLSWKGAT